MRWFWIDRFVEFESGKRARAIKNVSLAEEHLHDHYPGFPVMPGSLMLEGMAQTGGILLGETHNFEHIVILAKVPKVTYHSWACPGDTLTYSAELLEVRKEGGITKVTATCGERLVAEAEIVFVHLDESSGAAIPQNVDQKNFVFELGLMSILDVGKAGDGDSGK
ncbi:MAG: beta-hydroxyacyl-ACP dehydratase [Planctomycetota bacterium]|nr:MAG: beta-hydroxyacyl-ACP dehydratase [Planctomycetota bacterium]REJ96942.1 MAG: beta-hydroxyacyl-ACP dehydratase [Planctomycetota bacterium]REK22419.1 MAG: beta-hydroxyacyl-ACP dehydratase [Planctomycetota bacterium]REK34931.1 MAG: beta-hydroxyacyl-ACP dehydratase [Planctomycetota bacterium]